MDEQSLSGGGGPGNRLNNIAPGLEVLLNYRAEWLGQDLRAGLSVAAIALPTAIAYAQILGLDPVVGLYAAILPLVVYCLLGTSRHLIVNPDAATCTLVASALAPVAANDPGAVLPMSVTLAFVTGLVCLGAGYLRLGFVADFLSRPILIGFLNGIAIHIFLGQLGKIFGFAMHSHGIIPSLLELVRRLPETHGLTLVVGVLSIGVLLSSKRYLPRWPAALLAVLFATALVSGLDLHARGVAVVGPVPAGWPALHWPEFDPNSFKQILGGAMGVALLSFTNAMVVARTFAAKGGYEVNANQEFYALGVSQMAAGLSGAFAVSGTESRTAMNFASGGKSPLAGLTAAAAMAAVLLFFTEPLAYLPMAALGAVLIVAAIGLFDVEELVHLWHVSRAEFALAMITTIAVIALDVLDGILAAIGLALLMVLFRVSRPADAVLGRVPGLPGFHNIAHFAQAETLPGVLVYRFGSALWFFNAPHFRRRVLDLAAAHAEVRAVVVDGSSINGIDATGAEVLLATARDFCRRDIKLALADVRTEVQQFVQRVGGAEAEGGPAIYPSLEVAVESVGLTRH